MPAKRLLDRSDLGLHLDDQQRPGRCVPCQDVDRAPLTGDRVRDLGDRFPAKGDEQRRDHLSDRGVAFVDHAVKITGPPSNAYDHVGLEHAEYPSDRRHRHAVHVATLEQRDRRLRGAGTAGDVVLRQPKAMPQHACDAANLRTCHLTIVANAASPAITSDFTYRPAMPTPTVASATWQQVAALRLERHHLTRRLAAEKLIDVARDLVGIHAQVTSSAELQFAARVDGIRRGDVRDAIADRRLVKTWAMRGTLHLFAPEDLWRFVAAWPVRDNTRSPAWLTYFDVTIDQLDAVADAIGDVLDETPRTRAELATEVGERVGDPELGARLTSGWGQFLKPAAGRGLLAFGPDRGRNVTFVSPTRWLGKPQGKRSDPLTELGELTDRWLGTFPGASREAAARWWGIASRPTMTKALAAAKADITEVDIEGQKGWVRSSDVDVLTNAEPLRSVRLLPGFDPYVNELPRKTEALLPVVREALVRRTAGWVTPVVLVDGRVEGTWEIGQGAKGGIEVQPFGRLRGGATTEIKAEAERYAAFLDRPLKARVNKPLT